MSKRFLSGTYLAPYEFMMQQTPAATSIDKYEKKAKGKYISFLKQYMREYGYNEIIQRVMRQIGSMVFDDFLFCRSLKCYRIFWNAKNRISHI